MKAPGRRSAGILLWRTHDDVLEVLLGHPGGPFFAKKDAGAWGVLKGEMEPGEEPIEVARREFVEETGHALPEGPAIELGEIRQKGGKLVVAWAVEGDLDPAAATSNTFEMEWPPTVRTNAVVPGDRPRRVVRHGGGADRDQPGAGPVPGPAGGCSSCRCVKRRSGISHITATAA